MGYLIKRNGTKWTVIQPGRPEKRCNTLREAKIFIEMIGAMSSLSGVFR